MGHVRIVVVALVLLLSAVAAAANDTAKTVVILRAQSAGSVDDHALVDALVKDLQKRWPSRLHFYLEDVDPSRFSAASYRHDLPEYLRAKHDGRVDLLVVLSTTALDFVLSNRQLFGQAPILYAGSRPAAPLKPAGLTGVTVAQDYAKTIGIALELHPYVGQVVIVGGTGHADRAATELAQQQLEVYAKRVKVATISGLSFADLMAAVEALPKDSIVLYTRVTQDAAGAKLDPREVLQLLRRATDAPIYGCSRSYLGAGLVGGSVVDPAAVGRMLSPMASAILAGENVAQVRPEVADNVMAFDWGEVRRLRIERRLPAEAVLDFREPSVWERYSSHIPYFIAIGLVLLVLGASNVVQARKHRRARNALDERLRFEKNFADVSTSFITAPRSDIDTAVRAALQRVLETTHADCAAVYEAPRSSDMPWRARFRELRHGSGHLPPFDEWDMRSNPWVASKLRAGQVVLFMPGEEREQLAASVPCRPPLPVSAVVVPIAVGPSVLGAVWCLWYRSDVAAPARQVVLERFRLIAQLFANVLQRAHMEARLEETGELNATILESLVLQVAVLDRSGTIIAVNDAWMRFGRENAVRSELAIAPGVNYLETARRAAEEGAPLALEAFVGIRDVCEGRRQAFSLEYECSSPSEPHWYLMSVASLRRPSGGAVVTHRDITPAKQWEQAIRESEERFRLLADAMPVGVWMCDTNGRRTYFNRAWLGFTGGGLDGQLGDGWIYSLHPEDGGRYLDMYRSALAARAPFSTEYRLRKHDNGYGWFIDNAVPRYDPDGTFRGLVGGCLNVTQLKETEEALHDLTGRVIKAEEEDRRRIARDLHDGVSQLVALLAIEIEQLGQLRTPTPAELATRTHGLWKRTAEISADLHRVSHALHPSRLEMFGLVAGLQRFCEELSMQTQIQVSFSHEDVPAAIPPDAALCLFRIVQESLRNVVKHSGSPDASVVLRGGPDGLSLRVTDHGCGFDTSRKSSGLGLVSMRERVRFRGGEVTIASQPGQGTRIDVHLPLNTAVEKDVARATTRV